MDYAEFLRRRDDPRQVLMFDNLYRAIKDALGTGWFWAYWSGQVTLVLAAGVLVLSWSGLDVLPVLVWMLTFSWIALVSRPDFNIFFVLLLAAVLAIFSAIMVHWSPRTVVMAIPCMATIFLVTAALKYAAMMAIIRRMSHDRSAFDRLMAGQPVVWHRR